MLVVELVAVAGDLTQGGPQARRAVARQPDQAGLLVEGPADGLADPEGGVGGELEALAPVELVDGVLEAEVALLDQIEQLHARGQGIATGDAHDEAEVGPDESVLGVGCVAGGPLQLAALGRGQLLTRLEPVGGLSALFDGLRELALLLGSQEGYEPDLVQVLADRITHVVAFERELPACHSHLRQSNPKLAPVGSELPRWADMIGNVSDLVLASRGSSDFSHRSTSQLAGAAGLARALELGPGGTIQEVSLSGLRGRGGAGFPTGRKWQSVRESAGTAEDPATSSANGAEGEPGTFKDRAILRANPYQVVEGVAIAACAIGAAQAFIGVKASFRTEIDRARAGPRPRWRPRAHPGRRPDRHRRRARRVPLRRGDRPAPGDRGRRPAAPAAARRTSTGCSPRTPEIGLVGRAAAGRPCRRPSSSARTRRW